MLVNNQICWLWLQARINNPIPRKALKSSGQHAIHCSAFLWQHLINYSAAPKKSLCCIENHTWLLPGHIKHFSQTAWGVQEGYQNSAATQPEKAKSHSEKEALPPPSPPLLNAEIFFCHHFICAHLRSIQYNTPLGMNTLPLQKPGFKEGQIMSYQSFWVWKPLHPAGTVTYFCFQCTACYPRGTHNFRTKLFSSQTAGKAKPSSYIKHKQCTIGRLTVLRGSSSNTVNKSCNRTFFF